MRELEIFWCVKSGEGELFIQLLGVLKIVVLHPCGTRAPYIASRGTKNCPSLSMWDREKLTIIHFKFTFQWMYFEDQFLIHLSIILSV